MKKILAIILTLSIFLAAIPLSAVNVSAASTSDLTFRLNSDGSSYSVSECKASASGSLSIPSTYNGKPVTSIGDSAFYECDSLTSVTIPDSVTSIGDEAFYDCDSLTSVTIGSSVTSIGNYAFSSCTSLTSVTIGNSVTSIGYEAFYDCDSLTSVTIPDSVTSIGRNAFYNTAWYNNQSDGLIYAGKVAYKYKGTCPAEVIIKDGTLGIAGFAFDGCTSLTSVTIPDSVTSIGNSAFSWCDSLTSIEVSENNQNYSSVDGVLFNKAKTELIRYPAGKTNEDYTIHAGVTSIGDSAFHNCDSLTSVIIPDSVISIGDGVFYNCSSLTSITIPDSVTSIGDSAFHSCDSLTSVTIPDSVTSIENFAFYDCDSLTSVTIGNSVTSIGDWAFSWCRSLTSVTIGDIVTSIGNYAFYSCDSLKIVYYRGSQTDRKNITIGSNNSKLTGATWYYNSCIGSTKHSYTLNGNNSCNICKYSKAPDAPKTAQITPSSVTLEKVDGLEYSIDGVNWQDSNVFLNLEPETNYIFYQRVKASKISKVSEKSKGLNVTLKYTNTIIPSAPLFETKTDKTVTLVKTQGYEYSKNGTSWQSSNVFNNLSPNTEYTFYQRIAETNDTYASEKSEGLTVITYIENTNIPNKPTLLIFDDSSVTLKKVSGVEYSIDGVNWQESNVFNGLLPNTEYSFYQRYAQNGDIYHSATSLVLYVTTDRILQTEIPSAPTVESVTADKIILNKVDGCEYSKDGIKWQSSNVFNDLSSATEYTFYQRYAQNDTHYAGKKSSALTVKTEKGIPNVPKAPTLESKSHNRVTLRLINGYEYSMDGETWQKSNVFTGLNAFTNYAFFCRVAETEKNYASDCSDSLIVKTDVMPEFIIGDCNGDYNVDTTDLASLKLFLAAISDLSDTGKLGADLNCDGNVDTTDLATLKLKLAGIE